MTHKLAQAQLAFKAYTPWDASMQDFVQAITQRLNLDALMVGVINLKQPHLDEILACHGLPIELVQEWISSGCFNDTLLGRSIQQGSVTAAVSETGWNQTNKMTPRWFHYNLMTTCVPQPGWWFAAVGRSGSAIEEHESRMMCVLMRIWASRFNRPKEPDMTRLIIGKDDRLIYTDPYGEQIFRDHQITTKQIMNDLRETIDQRWEDLNDRETHDVVLKLSNIAWWIRFRRQRALDHVSAEYWYLELRPLDPDELTPVGRVADERIGRSLSYIHDHYHQSPSLTEIAEEIGISSFHYHRQFSKMVGITPKQYMLRKQVQMAKWMLRSSNTPIKQIALDTGFASHGHFTSTFKRILGISPTEYRRDACGEYQA